MLFYKVKKDYDNGILSLIKNELLTEKNIITMAKNNVNYFSEKAGMLEFSTCDKQDTLKNNLDNFKRKLESALK